MPRRRKKIRIRGSRGTRVGRIHVAVFNRVICAGLMERVDLNEALKEIN